VISSATHEIGHAGVAYLLGLRIFTLTIGPLHWRIHDDGWNFEFRSTNLISGGGSVGVSPIDGGNSRWRDICLFAAGSFANLLLGCIALWATLTAKGRPWEPAWELLAFTATISLTSSIINLIPVRTDATCSDGAHMRQLFRIGPWIDVHRAFSMVNSGMFTPLRPRDFDIEVIQRAARFVTRGRRAMDLRLFLFWHFFDAQQIPEALGALREAELVYEESPNIIGDLHANFIVGYALLKHDAERARWWWDRMEAQKVVPRNADYLMARCALLWSEGHIEWAWRAWEEGNAMVKSLPDAGAYEFDRSCFDQLRQALDAATSAARPDLN
jgi:hypothetical protein